MALFDTTNATATGIQDGVHKATIVGGEVKNTKAGTGSYLNLKWKTEAGSTFYYMYTLTNTNQTAVNIGMAELGRIQMAAKGARGPIDSVEELLGLSCMLTLVNVTDEYGEKIKIKKYAPIVGEKADNPFL